MRNRWIRLCLAALGMALGLTACNYEDGPVVSLRSKSSRLGALRPLGYYENNGIDSTAALNQRFEDSIPGFSGRFHFNYEPSTETQLVYDSEDILTGNFIGYYYIDGYDDFERITIYAIPGQTWPWTASWTITRLTHRKLWLEGPGGRLLRFEE